MKNDANMKAIRAAVASLKMARQLGNLELRFQFRITDLMAEAQKLHNEILAAANAEGTALLRFKEEEEDKK